MDFSSLAVDSEGSNASTVASWNFTDGTHTLTNLNSTAYFDPFVGFNDVNHPFANLHYGVDIVGTNGVDFSISAYEIAEATDSITVNNIGYGYEEGHPGTWTEVVSAPEPGSLLLLGLGLSALTVAISLRNAQPRLPNVHFA